MADVFLCHNNRDKPRVLEIARALEAQGIRPWLDRDQINAGDPFVRELDRAIATVPSAAVFVGSHGIGRWQEIEIRALLRHSVVRKLRLIPCILEDVVGDPPWPDFLLDVHHVDFRTAHAEPLRELSLAIRRLQG